MGNIFTASKKPTGSSTLIERAAGLLIDIIDPLLSVNPKVYQRVGQYATSLYDTAAQLNFGIWTIIWTLTILLNDSTKAHRDLWLRYRLTVIGLILVLGFAYWGLRKISPKYRHIPVIGLPVLITAAYSWSFSLGLPMPREYIILFPFLIAASLYRSFALGALIVFLSLLAGMPFWSLHFRLADVFTDYEMALFGLTFTAVLHWSLIRIRANRIRLHDLEADRAKSEKTYYNELLKFVSPSLVKTIKTKGGGYKHLVSVMDDLLKRRFVEVCVLYTDWRSFTRSSSSLSFIENELIPSSAVIIDICENNEGVSKQIADAIFTFFNRPDPEEALLLGMKSAFQAYRAELNRGVQPDLPNRFFILTFGEAIIGNMASNSYREITIIGSPANKAQRIDELTKHKDIHDLIARNHAIILDEAAHSIAASFSPDLEFVRVELADFNCNIRSFESDAALYLLPADDRTCRIIQTLLKLNQLPLMPLPDQEIVYA